MARISSAKRYAQAVFDLALEKNEFESWQDGLKKIVDLTADQKLMALLEYPSLTFAAKKSLLQERLTETNPLVLNLALLLVSKGLLRRSSDLLEKYNELLDAHRGVERAKVTTVLPLGDQEKDAVSQRLGKIVERKVVVDAQVDPSVIGGFIARIGDMLIDGSVHQKLESLKKNLVEVGRWKEGYGTVIGEDARIEARDSYKEKLEYPVSIAEHRYELRQRRHRFY